MYSIQLLLDFLIWLRIVFLLVNIEQCQQMKDQHHANVFVRLILEFVVPFELVSQILRICICFDVWICKDILSFASHAW